MTPERYRTLVRVLEQRQPDLTLITDEVHKGRNLAALRRTCDALGVGDMHCVIAQGEEQKRFAGTTAGSHKYVQLHRYTSIEQAVDLVRSQGMAVVAADLGDNAIDFQQFDFTRPVALMMGAEREGLSGKARQLADHRVRIPMLGMVESFNVSVAFALLLMEASRQRRAAGLYDQPRLPPEQIRDKLFEWGYPKLARYYRGKGLPYPPLDEEGQLIY